MMTMSTSVSQTNSGMSDVADGTEFILVFWPLNEFILIIFHFSINFPEEVRVTANSDFNKIRKMITHFSIELPVMECHLLLFNENWLQFHSRILQ